jgi:hypothetical protein
MCFLSGILFVGAVLRFRGAVAILDADGDFVIPPGEDQPFSIPPIMQLVLKHGESER